MSRTSRPLTNASFLLAAVAGLVASPVLAQSAAAVNRQLNAAHATEEFPLHAQVSLSHSLGSATFVPNPPNPTFSSTLALSPTARLAPGWTLGLDQRVGFEWTRSDSTTYANQLELSDLGVRVSYAGLAWDDLGLRLALTGGYNLPISLNSRQVGSIGPMALGSRLMWNHAQSGFAAYGSARIGVNPTFAALAGRTAAKTSTYDDRSLGVTTAVLCNLRNEAERDAFGCLDGMHPAGFTWNAGAGVNYTPPVLDGALNFALDLSYSQGFSRYIPPTTGTDNLGYDNASLKSDYAVDIAPRQSTSANLSMSYAPAEWFVLTGGAASFQPLFNARGNGIRLPLVDGFVYAANNMASLYVDTTFMF